MENQWRKVGNLRGQEGNQWRKVENQQDREQNQLKKIVPTLVFSKET